MSAVRERDFGCYLLFKNVICYWSLNLNYKIDNRHLNKVLFVALYIIMFFIHCFVHNSGLKCSHLNFFNICQF